MEFHNYINGRWVEKSNKFQTVNPANEEILAEIAQAEVSDVEDVVLATLRGEVLLTVSAASAAQAMDTERKSIYMDYSGKLQRAQIDNREE